MPPYVPAVSRRRFRVPAFKTSDVVAFVPTAVRLRNSRVPAFTATFVPGAAPGEPVAAPTIQLPPPDFVIRGLVPEMVGPALSVRLTALLIVVLPTNMFCELLPNCRA